MTILLGADTECLRSRRSVAKGCLGRQGTPRTPRDTSDAEGRLGCQGVPRARASLDRARRARAKIATERLATTRRYHQTATRTHLQPRAHARTHTHTHARTHAFEEICDLVPTTASFPFPRLCYTGSVTLLPTIRLARSHLSGYVPFSLILAMPPSRRLQPRCLRPPHPPPLAGNTSRKLKVEHML